MFYLADMLLKLCLLERNQGLSLVQRRRQKSNTNMTLFTTLCVLKVHVVRTTLVKLQDDYRKEQMNMLEKTASNICYNTHQSDHMAVSIDKSRIVKRGFKNQKMKRKISEALLIKKYKSSLNKHEKSVCLMLFNLSEAYPDNS